MLRKILVLVMLVVGGVCARAQVGAIQGFCNRGGQSATVSGLNSSNKFQNIINSCTISIYQTGTNTLVPGNQIFSNATGTVLGNPFTADNTTSLTPGKWLFFISTATAVDVYGSGGIAPNTYTAPVPLCIDCYASSQFTTIGVSWPPNHDIVLSNGTNTPDGLAEVDGNCVVGADGVWTAASCPGGSDGVQYNPTTTAYVFNGSSQIADDLNVLGPQITAGSWTANGTTVTVNTTVSHNLSIGSYVNVVGLTGWFSTPSPFYSEDSGYGSFKVASVPTSTQFTFAYSLNTGSGSGGWIADASYWGTYLPSSKPFMNGHGTPLFLNDSTSRLSGTAANFSALFGSVTGSPKYFIESGGQNDLGGDCASAATIEGYLQTIWADAHTAGFIVIQSTITPGHWGNVCAGPSAEYIILNEINQWIWGQGKSITNAASGEYWDNIIDAYGVIMPLSDTNIYASNGGFGPSGTQTWSNLVNEAMANQGSVHQSYFGYEVGPCDSTGGLCINPPRGMGSTQGWNWYGVDGNSIFSINQNNQDFTNIYRLSAYGPYGHDLSISNCTNNCNTVGMFAPALSGSNSYAYRQFGVASGSGQNVFEEYNLNSGNPLYTSSVLGCSACGFGYDQNGDYWLYGQKASSGNQPLQVDTNGKVTVGTAGGGTTTNPLTMNNSGSGASSGSTFNGSTAQTISYNSIGAAPLNSPNLTGIPTAPTPTFGTNNTDIATMAAVQAAIAAAGTGAGIVTYSGPSLTFSGTLYFPIGGGGLSSATESNVDIDSPAAVTIQNMTVQMSAAPGVGNSITYTWRKNASNTALTCTISGASATSCSDTAHNFTTASLDLLDIQAVTTGTVVGTPTVVMAAQVGVSTSSSGTTISLPTSGAQTAMTFDGNVPQKCPDTSGSGTAQSCSTGNAFTPAAGSCWVYTTTTTNSGTGLTVNVNSSGAKSVAVAGPSGWTTTLVASTSIPANKPMTMCYDGTNMNVSGTGYAPASGGTFQYSVLSNPPAVGAFTWVNQGTFTTSNNGNAIQIAMPHDTSLNWRFLDKAVPGYWSTAGSVAAFWKAAVPFAASGQTTTNGLYLYDGTKLLGIELLYTGNNSTVTLRVERITNVTTDNSTVFAQLVTPAAQNTWQLPISTTGGFFARWRTNGTTLFADYSIDGANWINMYSESIGAFITPTAYGFGGICENGSGAGTAYISMQGFLETSSGTL